MFELRSILNVLNIRSELAGRTRRESAPVNGGVPIVLTASACEMSDFKLNPFLAFTSAFPTNIIPREILRQRWYPPVPSREDGSAMFAPYGLRKAESLLLERFGEEAVVVSHPDNLYKFIGPRTRVVGISTMDPMGLAYVSTTYSSLIGFGGESINAAEFRDLITHPAIQEFRDNLKIIVGGSGSWQIEEAGMQDAYGIDTLVQGECEHEIVELFSKAMAGEKLPRVVHTKKPSPDEIKCIKSPSIYGIVEITRGCGRGCQFCSPTLRKRHSFSLEHILEEVRINASAGSRMIILSTEDVFLYKSHPGFIPNRDAILELFRRVAAEPGVEYIQISHASLAPVVYDPRMIEELSSILIEKTKYTHFGKPHITVEVGVETGSIRLLKKYMKGKALPYSVEDWHELVPNAVGILNDNGWYPLATLMTGLPGEREEDTLATLELLDRLKDCKMFYTPLIFIPLEDCMLHEAKRVDLKSLSDVQWDFIATCWRYNTSYWLQHPVRKANMLLGSLIAYLLYYRWKHGRRVIYPIMKFAGFPEAFLKTYTHKGCSPQLCAI
jgi:radical SAM superfamily enzyme YgiQ (UPF0313 family)